MNISAGISEIAFNRPSVDKIGQNKVYIWPNYGKSKIEKVQKISGYGAQPIYFKPTPPEEERILTEMQTRESSYGSDGKSLSLKTPIRPGSLFNALA